MIEIPAKSLSVLNSAKNLLAFSHGVDSTALFYILNDYKIPFDLAMVNYQTRENSDLEAKVATELAQKYSKKIFIKTAAKMQNMANFESLARKIRYEFFDEVMQKNGYQNLILAHQLNDCFEWFLMQFSKGSGLANLIGINEIEPQTNGTNIVRPLINTARDEIEKYLANNKIHHFIDSSNSDINAHKRNFFRHKFANEFISLYANGVKNSFEFLRDDKKRLTSEIIYQNSGFYAINADFSGDGVDKVCKILGVLLTQKSRFELLRQLKTSKSCVISHKIAVATYKNYFLIAPLTLKTALPKEFKERCRILKIPPILRPFLHKNQQIIKEFFS